MINIKLNKKYINYVIISKTNGKFSYNSFKSIQSIINRYKKLYKYVFFKNFPIKDKVKYIKIGDIILEFLSSVSVSEILKLLQIIVYKLSFKIRLGSLM